MSAGTFDWDGHALVLFDHPYNETAFNERAVEVPIARRFLETQKGRGLEVGNVLGHYDVALERDVVDLYEHADGVRNIDVFDVEGRYNWIVSISTVEHVAWDTEPRTRTGAADAIRHMRSLLAPHGRMLVTVPCGWHPHLDDALFTHALEPVYETMFIRGMTGDWRQCDEFPLCFMPYDWSTPSARSLWVAMWSGV